MKLGYDCFPLENSDVLNLVFTVQPSNPNIFSKSKWHYTNLQMTSRNLHLRRKANVSSH